MVKSGTGMMWPERTPNRRATWRCTRVATRRTDMMGRAYPITESTKEDEWNQPPSGRTESIQTSPAKLSVRNERHQKSSTLLIRGNWRSGRGNTVTFQPSSDVSFPIQPSRSRWELASRRHWCIEVSSEAATFHEGHRPPECRRITKYELKAEANNSCWSHDFL